MIVSDARREANRRNALKSTGPKTPEGKEKSRRNALTHGLTALVIVAEDAATFQARASECFWSLKPRTAFQRHLTDEVALIAIRTERAQRIERKLREKVALRAITSWDDDRRLDAERLGRDLPLRPAEVVAELRRTPQGCDWLIDRWAGLARLADAGRPWTDDRRRLAFDLLGTPPGLRDGDPGATIDADGLLIDPGDDFAAVARRQIAAIRESREVAAEHDEIDRGLAEADLTDEATPEIRRLRRHEAALHRRLRWCMARLQDEIPTHRPPFDLIPHHDPESESESEPWDAAEPQAPAPPAPPGPGPTATDDPAEAPDEPTAEEQNEATIGPEDEPGSPPALVADRRDARKRQAETRRDARKRKLDRRRA